MHAFHFLYVRFADDVRDGIGGIVRDAHDADAITDAVFAGLATKLQSYEPVEASFAVWILGVARNVALDDVRARRGSALDQVSADDNGDEATSLVQSRRLHEALRGLPPGQAQVLVLRHIAGLSPRETAERLGKTEASVRGLYRRGRQTLRAALIDVDGTPMAAENH